MTSPAGYTSIAREHTIEIEIQRSRFIATAVRVFDLDTFADRVLAERRAHRDARHVCTAAIVGAHGEASRSNDDGEPSGTAGAPMLQSIMQQSLTDVGVIVVRYFGGIKLGAGGLTRAYAQSATDALAGAGRVHRVPTQQVICTAPAADAGRIEHALRTQGFEPEVTYGVECTMIVDAQRAVLPALCDQLASLAIPHALGAEGFIEVTA